MWGVGMLQQNIFLVATNAFSLSLSVGAGDRGHSRSLRLAPLTAKSSSISEAASASRGRAWHPLAPACLPAPYMTGRIQMGRPDCSPGAALGPTKEESGREMTGRLLGDGAGCVHSSCAQHTHEHTHAFTFRNLPTNDTHVPVHKPTHLHTQSMHTHTHTYSHTYTLHTSKHMCIHTHSHTVHIYSHDHMHSYTHTCAQMPTNSLSHAYTHKFILYS